MKIPGLQLFRPVCVRCAPSAISSAISNKAVGATSVSERNKCHVGRKTAIASAMKTPPHVHWTSAMPVASVRGTYRPCHLSRCGPVRLKRCCHSRWVCCQAPTLCSGRVSVKITRASIWSAAGRCCVSHCSRIKQLTCRPAMHTEHEAKKSKWQVEPAREPTVPHGQPRAKHRKGIANQMRQTVHLPETQGTVLTSKCWVKGLQLVFLIIKSPLGPSSGCLTFCGRLQLRRSEQRGRDRALFATKVRTPRRCASSSVLAT